MEISELKDALIKVCKSDDFTTEGITALLSQFKDSESKKLFNKICMASANACDISIDEIFIKTRKTEFVISRFLIFRHFHSLGYTDMEISKIVKMDRITVKHGREKIQDDLDCDWSPAVNAYNKFKNQINSQK